MGYHACEFCADSGVEGYVPDSDAKWYQMWKFIPCPSCKGSGRMQPPSHVVAEPIKPRVTILLSGCVGQHFAVVDVDCVEIGQIPILSEQRFDQEFFDALRQVVIKCVDGR